MINSEILKSEEYDFLRTDPHLGNRVIMLGLGGSLAYGTNVETSDIDLRGVALDRPEALLGFDQFEQLQVQEPDSVIYSFRKIVKLLLSCNPNCVEMLGLKPEHYLYIDDIGRELLANRSLFLSKRAIQTFGGFADAQLRRLQNALARDRMPQEEKEKHVLNSLRNAMHFVETEYADFDNGSIRLYTDRAVNPDLVSEVFMDVDLKHYPLRDYCDIWNALRSVVRDYNQLNKRNRKKDDAHLDKHAMHLLRLFMTGIDLLEQGEIITYREKEHDLLMDVRNGRYRTSDGLYSKEFYSILEGYETRYHEAAQHTRLPDEPDMEKVEAFVIGINRKALSR